MSENTPPEMEEAPEQWRAIPGHEGYELSDRGRVRSWKIWMGASPPPRFLTIQQKHGRRRIQLGLNGGIHDVDVLMHEIWNESAVEKSPRRTMTWRRLMLTERQHTYLVGILEHIDSPLTRKLLGTVRSSKRVEWNDPILPDEVRHEEED